MLAGIRREQKRFDQTFNAMKERRGQSISASTNSDMNFSEGDPLLRYGRGGRPRTPERLSKTWRTRIQGIWDNILICLGCKNGGGPN